jgi:hypothetical protein
MGFLSPMVLAALAAVSIPIAIHLLNKFRVRETRWAAMRFVQDSLQKNRKKIQIEDLILLILRCLIVALLALAFARPVLKTLVAGDAPAGGDGPVAAVVLLDNSASMGQSDGVVSRFELGKKAIRDSLDGLEQGSSLAFYLVSNRADALIAKPSPDFTRVRRSLELVELNDRPTDLMRGIATAFEVLKPLAGARREIRLYTDSQRPGWEGIEEIRRLQQENPGVALIPHVLGEMGEDNLAVTGLTAEGGATVLNQACRFRVDVANFGAKPAESVRVTLGADDEPPSDEKLIARLEPGATQSVSLFVRFSVAGFHAVTATLPPDRLPADNTRTAAVRVVDRVRALIVEGSPEAPPTGRDGYFLANALVPVSFERAADYYMNVRTLPFKSLGGTDLASYDLVFLCNPGDPGADTLAALKKYAEQGGSLVFFPGGKTNPDRWKESWLPASWAARKALEKGAKPMALQADNYEHPVTSIWNNPGEGSLGGASMTAWLPLQPRKAEGETEAGKIQTVLRLANGEPAVVEGPAGQGRIAMFNSTATPLWNNLPLHPGFVPLIQRLSGYVGGHDAAKLVLSPGETFELEVPMELLGKDFSIARPGSGKEKRPAGRVDLDRQRAVLRYRDTEKAGAYRIYVAQEAMPRAVFAVQMDPKESDLRQLEAAELDRLKRAPEPAPEGAAAAPRMQVSREFWLPLIWAAALFILVEAALAHHFSRAR